MRVISAEELDRILDMHAAWLYSGGQRGKRAYLRDTDLRGLELAGEDLAYADMRSENCVPIFRATGY